MEAANLGLCCRHSAPPSERTTEKEKECQISCERVIRVMLSAHDVSGKQMNSGMEGGRQQRD